MGDIIKRADVARVLAQATLVALTDDDCDNEPDDDIVEDLISRAEAEVNSYLIGEYSTAPPPPATDPLLRSCAQDFFAVFAYERHPEYVRQHGLEGKVASRWERATTRMLRIQNARQRAPTVTEVPKNVGAVVVDGAPRVMGDSSDGSSGSML